MIKFALTLGLISSALTVPSFAEGANDASAGNNPVMIEIDGRKLTFTDVEKERPGVFFHAINTFYQGEQKALDEFVSDYLLDQQAKKEGLTVDQLLDLHVNKAIDQTEPPEAALKLYYEGVDTPKLMKLFAIKSSPASNNAGWQRFATLTWIRSASPPKLPSI